MHPYDSPQPQRGNALVNGWVVVALLFVIGALTVVLVVVLSGSDDTSRDRIKLEDSYAGTSRNVTVEKYYNVNGSAQLALQFHGKDPRALHGEIQVKGNPNIGGTGTFKGRLTGTKIELTVYPDGSQELMSGFRSYTLIGTVAADGTLSGRLSVPPAAGLPAQTGEWVLRPVK